MSRQKNNTIVDSVSGRRGNRGSTAFLLLLLVAMVLFTYRNVFDNSFVDWDDYTYVVENDLVRNHDETSVIDIFTTQISLNYHPFTILSLRLNNNRCTECPEGISPAPFIRWNVIIHILNTLLVFYLVFLLSGRKWFASDDFRISIKAGTNRAEVWESAVCICGEKVRISVGETVF